MADTYYVYQHLDPDTLECMYVGCGPLKRMFKVKQRNIKYLNYFKDKTPVIKIIGEFGSKEKKQQKWNLG